MEEKRKAKRMDLNTVVVINRLDGGKKESFQVEVTDLSKTGIGFRCKEDLEIGSMYEAEIVLWTKEKIVCLININRKDPRDGVISYGGTFIGMNDNDAFKIDVYSIVEENT